ncbi:MAG: circularly permuted type 2 ATP-grasp protein [Sulfurospirillaceae bacterium]|nr:circularly permuted type 2 ATP-grasp protein [Sulfurospirillaceae bacterium]
MGLFENYKSVASFDEMFDENKNLREHWRGIYESIQNKGLEELGSRQAEIDWHLEENGVTYNIYNNPEGNGNRPWRLDPIPFVITGDEWKEVKKGIKQRATLLNLIFRDLYGEQKLIRDNIIPAEVIYGHKGFCSEVYNFGFKDNFNLYFYAVDMARGPDGKLWVISDRTQAPSGLGYSVENRLTLNNIAKELYPAIEVKKLSLFVEEFKTLLHKLSDGDISKVAVLTPGPHNETYFEHSYLSSFLETNLVQGDDLLCKNGALWLKSLSGLKPINTLVRRVDDKFCDPLELRNDSKLGVPGMVDAMRQDNLIMVNPIGSAILENIGLNPFMENIAQYFLNEELILPQIATWWCGQPSELAYVLENLSTLIVKKIDRTESVKTYLCRNLSFEALAELRETIIKSPNFYAAQEEISFSTIPNYTSEKIEPRNAVIRAYSLKRDENYTVMNGGLVRVSASKDSLLVSSQRGGTSKDLWILGTDKRNDNANIFKNAPYVETSLRHMSTLKAENLFWLGRYLARSITTSRFLRYLLKNMANTYRYEEMETNDSQRMLQNALTHLTMTYPGFLDETMQEKLHLNPMNEILSVIRDRYKTGSLTYTIGMLANANVAVKNLLAVESAKIFDKLQKEWFIFVRKQNNSKRAVLSELDKVLIYFTAYKELVDESMYKEQGLTLFEIGYTIENALLFISKARSMLCFKLDKSVAYDLLEGILSSSESFNAYRTQYKSALQLENVIEFLVFNPQFPKSLSYITNKLLGEFKTLPKSKPYLTAHEAPMFKAYSLLKLTKLSDVMELEDEQSYTKLDTMLSTLSDLFAECSTELCKTYFSHYDE